MEISKSTPTVDVVVYRQRDSLVEVLLIERANPPHGWALPGGFVDEWETVETAANPRGPRRNESQITLDSPLYVYSNPQETVVSTICPLYSLRKFPRRKSLRLLLEMMRNKLDFSM